MKITLDITGREIFQLMEDLDWVKSGIMDNDPCLKKMKLNWYRKILKACEKARKK